MQMINSFVEKKEIFYNCHLDVVDPAYFSDYTYLFSHNNKIITHVKNVGVLFMYYIIHNPIHHIIWINDSLSEVLLAKQS